MGRGVSSGGGQSSLRYLFGSDETPKPAANQTPAADSTAHSQKPSTASPPVDASKQIPAVIQQKMANNYHRADGQNSGNVLTVMLPEAIAIVMAPTDTSRTHGIFHLTDLQERGFHPHEVPPDGSPIDERCLHVYMNSNLKFDFIHLHNSSSPIALKVHARFQQAKDHKVAYDIASNFQDLALGLPCLFGTQLIDQC